MIPYPLFLVLLDTLPARRAEMQLVITQAVTQGYLGAKAPDDLALQAANQMLIDQAYPLEHGRTRLTTQDPDALIANIGAWGKHGGLWLLERD